MLAHFSLVTDCTNLLSS